MSVQVLKGVAVLVLSAAFFVAGYQYAAALYGEDIANFKLEAAIVRANDGRKAYDLNFPRKLHSSPMGTRETS